MRRLVAILVVLFLTFSTGILAEKLLGFMSLPNDAAVMFSALGVVAIIGLYTLAVPKIWRFIMKKRTTVAKALVVLLAVMAAIGCTRIDGGHVGIKIDNAGSSRGVSDIATTTGWVWYMPGQSIVYEFPISVQTAMYTGSAHEGRTNVDDSITFPSKGGSQFHIDLSVAYHIDAKEAPKFFVRFRSDDMESFRWNFFKNIVRESIAMHSAHYEPDDIMGEKLLELLGAARGHLEQEAKSFGVTIDQFGPMGAPRPPEQIATAINAKNQAIQLAIKAENELRQKKAEAAKSVAEAEGSAASTIKVAEGEARATLTRAEAQAKANHLLSESLTPTLIQYRLIDKWNGTRPQVEGSGGLNLLLNASGSK